jgi:hypothetical protein
LDTRKKNLRYKSKCCHTTVNFLSATIPGELKHTGINSKDTKQIITPFYTFVPEEMLGQSFKQFIKKKDLKITTN